MEEIRLMPKAVALWLKNNTKLTEEQIAKFCKLKIIDVESINDRNTIACNPITETKELTAMEIERCEKNPSLELKALKPAIIRNKRNKLSKMQKAKIPGVVLWILSNYSKTFNKKVLASFLGTTTTFIQKTIDQYEVGQLKEISVVNPIKEGFFSEADLKKIF